MKECRLCFIVIFGCFSIASFVWFFYLFFVLSFSLPVSSVVFVTGRQKETSERLTFQSLEDLVVVTLARVGGVHSKQIKPWWSGLLFLFTTRVFRFFRPFFLFVVFRFFFVFFTSVVVGFVLFCFFVFFLFFFSPKFSFRHSFRRLIKIHVDGPSSDHAVTRESQTESYPARHSSRPECELRSHFLHPSRAARTAAGSSWERKRKTWNKRLSTS